MESQTRTHDAKVSAWLCSAWRWRARRRLKRTVRGTGGGVVRELGRNGNNGVDEAGGGGG